jgi:hypothetical protein
MRQRDQRQKCRCYRHHHTRSEKREGRLCSRTKRRASVEWLWATHCHNTHVMAFDRLQENQAASFASTEEILRSIEADWIMGEGDPDIILNLSAIGSFAQVIYELIRGDTTWDGPRVRRLRLIVAKHLL